jgi:hypothetical protein
MILDASGRLTGVEAVHTDPVQWLKTTVDVAACHVIRKERSCPRTSANTSDPVLTSSTKASMTRVSLVRHGASRSAESVAPGLTRPRYLMDAVSDVMHL